MVDCYLCKLSQQDDVLYGDMLERNGMSVHTHCLYLSSNLSQRGADDEGFLGFLEKDIKAEARRVARLDCCFCRKYNANIGCCEAKCRRSFHLICGIANGAQNQYCNRYQSYCNRHLKAKYTRPPNSAACIICYENLVVDNQKYIRTNIIQAPCCKNGWFHKHCLQRFAKTAGYFFKCPLCNDARTFRAKLPVLGIFIPNQDAAWELEPNAFSELLERPSECAAANCFCRHGRTHKSDANPFVFCSTCGSTAMHKGCIANGAARFNCDVCAGTLEQDSGRESLHMHEPEDNDEEIDVCHVSDKEDIDIVCGLMQANEEAYPCDDGSDTDQVIMPRYSRRTKRIQSSDTNSSDTSKENCPPQGSKDDKPNVSRQAAADRRTGKNKETRRIIIDESSDDELESLGSRRKPCSRSKNPVESQLPEKTIMSSNNGTSKGSETNSVTQNEKINIAQRVTTRYSQFRRSADIFFSDESNDKPETPPVITESSQSANSMERRRLLSNSSEENISRRHRTKRPMALQSDEDSSDNTPLPPKHGRSDISNASSQSGKKNVSRLSDCILCEPSNDSAHTESTTSYAADRDSAMADTSMSDGSDDDPVECFTKMVEMKNGNSFVAQRTRTKFVLNATDEDSNSPPVLRDKTKHIQFVNLQSPATNTNSLETSCIARRTRRKSMAREGNDLKENQEQPVQQSMDSSNIASRIRNRRKTVCLETEVERKKQAAAETHAYCSQSSASSDCYELSQIYEKEHFTDDESDFGKTKPLEISCIANRTRRRVSMKLNNILEEEEDSSHSAASTADSWHSAKSYSSSNSNSTSAASSCGEETRGKQRYVMETFPKQKYDLAFRRRTSYHPPSQQQYSYVNNRRRV